MCVAENLVYCLERDPDVDPWRRGREEEEEKGLLEKRGGFIQSEFEEFESGRMQEFESRSLLPIY